MSGQEKGRIILRVYVLQLIGFAVAAILMAIFGFGPILLERPFETPSFLQSHLAIALLYIMLLAPILEEVIFRGPVVLIRKWMSDKPLIWWICGGFLIVASTLIWSSLFFTILHFRALIPALFILWTACLFTWEATKTRSLWPSIFNHIIWNNSLIGMVFIIKIMTDSISKLIG